MIGKIARKYGVRILMAILIASMIVSCGAQVPQEEPVAEHVGTMSITNNLETGSYKPDQKVIHGVTLQSEYSTDYDASSWRITTNKTLKFKVNVIDLPQNVRVQMSHVHVDTSLVANNSSTYSDLSLNGQSIDSMDDKLSTGQQGGVEMTATAPYVNIFSIDGMSKEFQKGWGYFLSGYGGRSESYTISLTEENLKDEGVIGQKFTFVYEMLFSVDGGDWAVGTFADEFYVPTATDSGQTLIASQIGAMDISDELANGPYTPPSHTENGIVFQPEYTTSYDASNWRITTNKTLNVKVNIVSMPEGVRVQMAHVHIDSSLVANPSEYSWWGTRLSLNGRPIDSMDNKLSSGDQIGAMVSPQFPFTLIMSVDGLTVEFTESWSYYLSGYGGSSTTRTVQLTEKNLIEEGVIGQKFTIIYKFVYSIDDGPWSVGTFADEFYIPVGGAK